MPRNVLLMLSTDQPPYPTEEIRYHAVQSAEGKTTALVTTRRFSGLTPGRSVLAFYSNAALGNRYLGRAIYREYVGLETPRGRELLREHKYYGSRGIPEGARGFLVLSDVQEARVGEELESLNGTIEASGLPLTLENLPRSAARIQVYFR
jgi:hypothetical protein